MTHGRAHLNKPSLPAGRLATDRQADTHTHSHPYWCEGLPGTNAEGAALTWLGERGVWEGMGCAMWPPQWSVGPAFSRPHLVCAGPTPPSPQCHPTRAKVERIRGACLKHCDNEKKELVEGAKSQTDGNAMVIIELRAGGVRNHEKGRLPAAPGRQREGLSPQGAQRREPERLGGSPAPATEPVSRQPGRSWPRKGGLRQTVSSSLMSQISAAWVS